MSRKHNTKHNRSKSNYPDRLAARGVSNVAVRMKSISDSAHDALLVREGFKRKGQYALGFLFVADDSEQETETQEF